MMLDVLKRLLYFVGHTTAQLMWLAAITLPPLAYEGTPPVTDNPLNLPAV